MIRVTFLGLLVAAVAGVAAPTAQAQKQLPVAPPPREVRPDGSHAPLPQPAKAEDPAAVVERIIKNSKDVGDRLEKTDTGTDTRKKQDTILSDIDALINRQEDPPPPKPDDKDKDDKKDDKKDDMNKDPMMNKDMPPKDGMPMNKDNKKDMGMGKNDMPPPKHENNPMGGMNDPPPMPMGGNERKPRMGSPMGDDKKDQQPEPKPDDKKQQGAPKDQKDPKGASGAAAGGPGGKLPAKALIPVGDDGAKDVWGHLPDRLRQQMTQYYSEDVMPKYAELLRLYYSSFSEAGAAPVVPKK